MGSIGDRLREERLQRRLSIEQIADQTKIHASMLEAIEADAFDRLPRGFFTRSFVRQYARALGLREDEFDEELDQITGVQTQAAVPQESGFRPAIVPGPISVSMPRSRFGNQHPLGSLVAFLLIVAACSAIYTLWERTRSGGPEDAAEVTESAKPVEARPPQPIAVQASRQAAPAAAEPLQQQAGIAQSGPEAAAESPAPAASAPLAAPSTDSAAPVRVAIRATAPAWVRVSADEKTLFEGVLQANESRSFEGQAGMILRTGNAGGLEITYNGKPAGPIGPPGQVRTVEFTPDSFRVLTPAPRPPDDAP